jgi:two-component system KDP operon response regulator KdpE
MIRLDQVEIHLEARRVIVGQKAVHFSPKEFDLLKYLASHPNRAIPHSELLREVWGAEPANGRNYMRTFVNRLRKKIEASPREPKLLVTDPFFGYRLRVPKRSDW